MLPGFQWSRLFFFIWNVLGLLWWKCSGLPLEQLASFNVLAGSQESLSSHVSTSVDPVLLFPQGRGRTPELSLLPSQPRMIHVSLQPEQVLPKQELLFRPMIFIFLFFSLPSVIFFSCLKSDLAAAHASSACPQRSRVCGVPLPLAAKDSAGIAPSLAGVVRDELGAPQPFLCADLSRTRGQLW